MTCPVCGLSESRVVYYGAIRGAEKGTISECAGCGVQSLSDFKMPDYEKGYREEVGFDDLKRHISAIMDIASMDTAINGKVVIDIGASNGLYLNGINHFAKKAIGIEPNTEQRDRLSPHFDMYPCIEAALMDYRGKVDTVTMWHVLEHVEDPVGFMMEASQLLCPQGKIYLSTPNRNDVLMRVLPDQFPAFFYRAWHPFYYSPQSLSETIANAGLVTLFLQGYHSWGIGNALGWCRDKKPVGRGVQLEPYQAEQIDLLWKHYLADVGMGDTLYAICAKSGEMH